MSHYHYTSYNALLTRSNVGYSSFNNEGDRCTTKNLQAKQLGMQPIGATATSLPLCPGVDMFPMTTATASGNIYQFTKTTTSDSTDGISRHRLTP